MGRSKVLAGFYALVTLCMLAGAIVSIVFSFIFRKKDLLYEITFDHSDEQAGLALGIMFAITTLVSVFAIIQKNHVTSGLVALNWLLIADSIADLVVGTKIWFFSLRQRNEYHTIYGALAAAQRIEIQDKFSCCGYFNPGDLAEVGGSFCQNTTFIQGLNASDPNTQCVTGLTKDTDYALENTFTSIYGFMAIIICLFMASMCVIKEREEIERFRKIDAKRGGRGFV